MPSDGEVPTPRRAAGRVVPVYAVTGGRTRSAGKELPVEALITVTHSGRHAADLQLEYRTILGLAAAPVSLVEVGAHLQVPVGVARVLVGDLADAGYVAVHLPQVGGDGTPGPEILERLLEGLRARSG
ncbi:DUF742 domain-containing protein [Pseudonocardia xishanensis]|uniref:DUF742 domain-containing protein n=1 Tax=Pseudonocardia xishanensis TaxID=630995 RepID=A0ABP8RJZ8_9PSEU